MIRQFVCIQCPRGCHLEVDDKTLEVKGNFCPRGEKYGQAEVSNPVRTITSTVKIKGAMYPRCSVRTTSPVSKAKMFEVMEKINQVEIIAPVDVGDIIIKDVCDTGSDVIATKRLEKID